jgi:myosin heavy subunit
MNFIFGALFQLFLLEELRERKFDGYARRIQKAYRMYKNRKYFAELKQQGTCMVHYHVTHDKLSSLNIANELHLNVNSFGEFFL